MLIRSSTNIFLFGTFLFNSFFASSIFLTGGEGGTTTLFTVLFSQSGVSAGVNAVFSITFVSRMALLISLIVIVLVIFNNCIMNNFSEYNLGLKTFCSSNNSPSCTCLTSQNRIDKTLEIFSSGRLLLKLSFSLTKTEKFPGVMLVLSLNALFALNSCTVPVLLHMIGFHTIFYSQYGNLVRVNSSIFYH